jgi:hypothetical protein
VPSPDEAVFLVGVYRARNAERVRELFRPALEHGWKVAWWALDEVADDLREVTVGSGPGEKLPLPNEILRRIEPVGGWLVVSDDDVVYEKGDVVELVSLSIRARFDLAQPARADTSGGHEITFARKLSVARRTSFVEIGPVFAVGPGWYDRIVPFPEERGMGWGLELKWIDLFRTGCVLGVVDAVQVRHDGPPGPDYDHEHLLRRMREELAEHRVDGWPELQQTFETWRPRRRSPRWASDAERALR